MAQQIGRIFQDGETWPEAPKDSDLRKAILGRLEVMRQAAWEQVSQEAVEALLDVMTWHAPWACFEQVFKHGGYWGTRYLGPGCRACGPGGALGSDCRTVRIIAERLGVTA